MPLPFLLLPRLLLVAWVVLSPPLVRLLMPFLHLLHLRRSSLLYSLHTHLHTLPKPPEPISSRILYSLYSHWWGRGVTHADVEPPMVDSSERLLVLLRERRCRPPPFLLLLSSPAAPYPVLSASSPLSSLLSAAESESSSSSLSLTWFASSCQPAQQE